MSGNTTEKTELDDTTGLDPYWIPNRASETGFFTQGGAEDWASEELESRIVKTVQVAHSYHPRWDQTDYASQGQQSQNLVWTETKAFSG